MNREIPFNVWTTVEEIKLRGRVMTMSCDLELILLNIILASVVGEPEETLRSYRNMTMEAKIHLAKHDLEKYHKNEFVQYSKELKQLDNICNFRNKFAHCKMEWSAKKDKSYFNLLIITNIDGTEHLKLVKMTFVEFNERAEKMRQTLLNLLPLSMMMDTKARQIFPNLISE